MVLITGIGLIAPHGNDPQAMFAAVMRGQSAVHEVFAELAPALAPALATTAAAATAAFDAEHWFTPLQLAGVDRVSQMAVAAADLALRDAGLSCPGEGCAPERLGVFVGCGMGGGAALAHAYQTAARIGRVPPLTIPAFMPNAAAAHIAMRHQAQGPVLTFSMACASSSVALAEAAKAVQRGEIDVAIAGGSEAAVIPSVMQAWQAMQTLARFAPGQAARACRPFAAERSGFVLGEGASFMVLESAQRAQSRGARAYAELAGGASRCDATHLTKPDAQGQARALRAALAEAELTPNDIGYCNAHGTATRIGDVVEAQALQSVWGSGIDRLRVSSTKALHGHLLGASGALEAAITVLALQRQQLPPNAHGDSTDPDCPLNLILQRELAAPQLQAAISSSFAFGGSNAVLVFKRV